MSKKPKPKKPLVDINVDCPHCSAGMRVKVFRTRVNPSEPAEYEYKNVVILDRQGKLFDVPKKGGAEVRATKKRSVKDLKK